MQKHPQPSCPLNVLPIQYILGFLESQIINIHLVLKQIWLGEDRDAPRRPPSPGLLRGPPSARHPPKVLQIPIHFFGISGNLEIHLDIQNYQYSVTFKAKLAKGWSPEKGVYVAHPDSPQAKFALKLNEY